MMKTLRIHVLVLAIVATLGVASAQERRATIHGRKAGARAGTGLAILPDLNADGVPEIALGSPGFSDESGADLGRLYVADGRTREPLFALTGLQANEQLGGTIRAGGDLDGDGVADFLSGSGASIDDCDGECFPPPLPGALSVFSGADGSTLLHLEGAAPDENLGASAAMVPDLDGDGIPELVVGSTGVGFASHAEAGRISILAGGDLRELMSARGTRTRMQLGFTIEVFEDGTGDGKPEIAVGAPGYLTVPGEVHLFSGADPEPFRILRGECPGDRFGRALASVDDVDGDGVRDFLVGAPHGGTSPPDAGTVFLYGSAPGSQPGPIRVYPGEAAGDRFGWSVADAGDVDGDGVGDHLVGAPTADPEGLESAGTAYLFSGRDGSEIFRIRGDRPGDRLGAATVGGLSIAGFSDVLLAAPGCDPGGREDAGSVFVHRLDPSLPCLAGNVNAGAGGSEIVLTVNGSAGTPRDRVVGIERNEPIRLDMAAPPSRAQSRFALYAYIGLPDEGTVVEQPFGIGATCFDTPLNGNFDLPRLIWNNLGEPLLFGVPDLPSSPAPSTVLELEAGWSRRAVGTLQGFIRDDASAGPDGLSITNAVSIVIP
jgi:hypothetical protein